MPVGWAFGMLFAALGVVGHLVVPESGQAPAWWFGAVVAVLVLGSTLTGCIVLFNAPKALVPPWRRGEPGALQRRPSDKAHPKDGERQLRTRRCEAGDDVGD